MANNMQARAFGKSLAVHAAALVVVLLLPAGVLRRSAHPDEVEVVFHRPTPPVELPAPVVKPLPVGPAVAVGPKSAPAPPKANSPVTPAAPVVMETPGLPEAPPEPVVAELPPQQKVAKSGLLALRDQFASIATEKNSTKLGAAARVGQADDTSRASSTGLLTAGVGGSGGINMLSLSRDVGGGGGGGSGGGGSMQGVAVGRATSSIAGIGGGGGPRKLGGGGDGTPGSGVGPARTDEEIQIVFDRHKASFYRLYHQELRNDPSLRGQMVLRLTIEPDGSVSMCALQSSDMKAPALATQVVNRVREINFGAKEGVKALTIVYPIDFLPAA